jgi:hypothetical protein
LFDAEDVLSIELRGPLQTTMEDKRNPGSRKFVLTAGEREFEVSVKLRGNSRIRACRFRHRIFAMLSDVALRTRLLKIRYIDTEKATSKPVVRYGFLIESEGELAARTGGEILHVPNVNRLMLNTRQAAVTRLQLHSLFSTLSVIRTGGWSRLSVMKIVATTASCWISVVRIIMCLMTSTRQAW